MRTLIFDESLSGHHLEYLHHYYIGACERPNEEYVICVPQGEFESKKDKYDWPKADNISFEWLSEDDANSIRKHAGSAFRYGMAKSKTIAKYAKKCKVQKVLLTNFISSIPQLLWLMPKGVTVRGIIYRIFLYNKLNSIRAKIRYAVENFCYHLMAKSKVMDKVFILNDQKSADRLNEMHHTTKFTFLPDPVPQVDMSKVKNIRQQFDIPMENKVFLHFGGLAKRKGTLDILNAIIMSDAETLSNKTFVFAGKVYQEMHDEFYRLVADAKQKAHILIFDEFCEYDFLYDMCYSCDVILAPYHQTNLSSGLLGYAALFRKPIVGPGDGLIGNLIRDYQMGYCMPNVSALDISKSFTIDMVSRSKGYVEVNDVKQFTKVVLS